jgi:hypothetical protein
LKPQDFYTLHAVYLAWFLRDAHGAEYLKQTREHGLAVGFISITDRKSVVDWLEGKVNDLDNIAPPMGSPSRATTTDSSAHISHTCSSAVDDTPRFSLPWCSLCTPLYSGSFQVYRYFNLTSEAPICTRQC